VLLLLPKITSPALVYGGTIHKALEKLYKTHSIQKAQDTFTTELTNREKEYAEYDTFESDYLGGQRMLENYYQTFFEKDINEYHIIEGEKQYELPIGPEELNFSMTIKPDLVLQDKTTKEYLVRDFKTTGYSISKALKNAECNDQVTGYIWALNKAHPDWNLSCAQIDILYHRRGSNKYESFRGDEIYRTKYDLANFELTMTGIIRDVSEKVKHLNNLPSELLFPRHGAFCGLFGCEYEDICRNDLSIYMDHEILPPHGFMYDTWEE
jgi:hypothetical protein